LHPSMFRNSQCPLYFRAGDLLSLLSRF
jgi:hypothetical protein